MSTQNSPPWGHQMVAGMAETGQRYDEPLHEKKEGRSTRTLWQSPA
jgi:hypothetical protein